jgi:hypothetical protein
MFGVKIEKMTRKTLARRQFIQFLATNPKGHRAEQHPAA